MTVINTLIDAAPDSEMSDVKALLGRMMFSGTAMEKKVRCFCCPAVQLQMHSDSNHRRPVQLLARQYMACSAQAHMLAWPSPAVASSRMLPCPAGMQVTVAAKRRSNAGLQQLHAGQHGGAQALLLLHCL